MAAKDIWYHHIWTDVYCIWVLQKKTYSIYNLPQQICILDEDHNIDWSVFRADFICRMEHSQYFSIIPMMHLWLYKYGTMCSMKCPYHHFQLYTSARSLWYQLTVYIHTSSMIIKVFSQQLLYTILEQKGINSEEECLYTTQREIMKIWKLHLEMCKPFPLM